MKNLYMYSIPLAKSNKLYISLTKYILTYIITLLISTLTFLLFKKIINLVQLSELTFRIIIASVLFVIIIFDFLYILFPNSLKFHSRLKAYYIYNNEIYLISISDLVLIMFETTLFLPRVNKKDKDNNLLKKIKYIFIGIITSPLVFSKIKKNINKMQDEKAIIKFVKDPVFYKRSANVYKLTSINTITKYNNKTNIHVDLIKVSNNKVIKDNTLVIYNTYNHYNELIKEFENRLKN